MLINLSNHPAYKIENGENTYVWSEKQLSAASIYGEIVDMPFPNIPPELSSVEVSDLATVYLHKCEELIQSSINESAIHITGEVTFCFVLIQMLLKKGYKCITATSNRNVETKDDGTKIAIFEFEHFREYKII